MEKYPGSGQKKKATVELTEDRPGWGTAISLDAGQLQPSRDHLDIWLRLWLRQGETANGLDFACVV